MHILLRTDDLFWATAVAGVLYSASQKEFNPKFKFTVESELPEIKYLAEYFDQPGPEMTELKLPETDREFMLIDLEAAQQQSKELELLHNMRTDGLNVVQLPISHLAANLVLKHFGLVGDQGFYYPSISKKVASEYAGYHAIADGPTLVEKAEQFLKGYGIEDPKILDISSMNTYQQIIASQCPGLKIIVVPPCHNLCPVVRSKYKGYDNMRLATPVLMVVDPAVEYDYRRFITWAACIPVYATETGEHVFNKGGAWQIRESCNHDHHEYRRRMFNVK